MKRQQFISHKIFITLLSIIFFAISVNIALADGPVAPHAVAVDGWGIDFDAGYIRPNGKVVVAVHAQNLTGQALENVEVSIEVNGVTVKEGPFSLADQGDQAKKHIQKKFNADPLPPVGQDVFASVTMCVGDQCALPTVRKLNDERESSQGAPLSTRIRYRLCEIQLMVLQDPDFVLSTNGQVIASGHLDAREWSQWFDLSDFATYPPSSLDLTLEATWDGHAAVTEHFTIPAEDMACKEPTGSVEAIKVDQYGKPWAGIKVILYKDGLVFSEGHTPVTFDNLELGHYRIEEKVPARSEPLGPTSFDFTLDQEHLHYVARFQNRRFNQSCDNVDLNPSSGNELSTEGQSIEVEIDETGFAQDSNAQYQIVNMDAGTVEAGPTTKNRIDFHGYPEVKYEAQRSDEGSEWNNVCSFEYTTQQVEPAVCTLTTGQDVRGNTWINLGAVDENGNEVTIDQFKANSNFSYHYPPSPAANLPVTFQWPRADSGEWYIRFEVSTDDGLSWLGGNSCQLNYRRELHTTGQYQDFIGAVPFGTFTPYLEPGKEYFDMTRSIMYNVEYFNGNQGEVVYRFNGQEIDGVISSLFHAGSFNQIESDEGRAVTTFNEGVTKLIAYRYGQEQARIFQTMSATGTRWIHPLDQPFEHKYEFELELHGPAGTTDLLVYGNEQREVHYDQNGVEIIELTYSQPGLVAIYPTVEDSWVSVDSITFPITTSQSVNYSFAETGLYHYRILDATGKLIAGPVSAPSMEFSAEPGITYQLQLAYPATSIFVGLYDDMKFQHPDYWTMPIDGRFEHDHEFHLDYHRENDPDLGDDHVRGDVVIDALYLINGTTSVAQQFPYGRHDGALAGVTIVGIPDVSMVAFCQRPGVHEVVYYGGWENESYYLPERGMIFDQEIYDRWTEDQRGDCIDAAQRVNQALAREGLRTDHTYRHHGEQSQGYQMTQQHIWSPYNLAGMRPPHIGQFLKPGMVLPYFEEAEDMLFWGWDLDNGDLADGIGASELQQHVASFGPVVYGDQTGIHPSEELN